MTFRQKRGIAIATNYGKFVGLSTRDETVLTLRNNLAYQHQNASSAGGPPKSRSTSRSMVDTTQMLRGRDGF
jgi:hypothetical protein